MVLIAAFYIWKSMHNIYSGWGWFRTDFAYKNPGESSFFSLRLFLNVEGHLNESAKVSARFKPLESLITKIHLEPTSPNKIIFKKY